MRSKVVEESGSARVQRHAPGDLFAAATRALKPATLVLDIGPGIRPQQLLRPRVHICVEPYEKYVEELQRTLVSDLECTYLVVKATWAEACRLFPPASVDTVFLLDVIEHLEKDEGRKLLATTCAIATRQVALFTPLGFLRQDHPDGTDQWGMAGGDWQTHRSGWLPQDFDASWEILVAEGFHTHDNLGRPLEKPHGGMWAIQTKPSADRTQIRGKRQRGHVLLDRAIDAASRIVRRLRSG